MTFLPLFVCIVALMVLAFLIGFDHGKEIGKQREQKFREDNMKRYNTRV